METHRNLLIIPGMGDRERLYATVLPLWRHFGYNAQIYSFGWNNSNNEFNDSLKKLEDFIVCHQGRLAIIGASAGGTAAIHVGLRHPDKVDKVVAISTPLRNGELARTQMLSESIDELEPALADCEPAMFEDKVLTVFGFYDQKVNIDRSQYDGMPQLKLPVVGHEFIIASSLTFMSGPVRHWLER